MTTSLAADPQTLPPTRPHRRVAVVPAYNEETTIVGVLERLEPLADEVIVVDDGSVDRTREVTLAWAEGRPNVKLICFNQNQGMSAAYYRAFQELRRRVDAGLLDPDDLVLTVDADGQHDPEEVDELVEYLTDNRLDALIARRDLSNYTLYKKAGNFIMSLWASLWAGKRLYDVESGYRIFRLGALLAALKFYKGYRYSETVEVAVILPRLGYRIDNTYVVPVPIFRSRTRLKDVAIDLAAIPAAAWRVAALREAPPDLKRWMALALALVAPVLLLGMTIGVLSHRLYLSSDSMQHYSHVWYISTQLFQHGHLPLHIALLDSGNAMTFPYATVPYLAGAALHPLLGDWAVSLLAVVGFVGLVLAMQLARPAMRSPWLLLIFVLNPFFIDSLLAFQFASIWSGVFFFLFVWSLERRRLIPATLFSWLALTTHPEMGGFAVLAYGLYLMWRDRSLLKHFEIAVAVSGVAALPFVWMTFETPGIGENSVLAIALSALDSVVRRGTVLALPFVLPPLDGFVRRNYSRVLVGSGVALVAGILFSAGIVPIGDLNHGTYSGVFHSGGDTYAAFFQSPAFVQGATYRVMEPTDREDGMYRFMQHGAVIGNEFFGESYQRRNWTPEQFSCYVQAKSVSYDVIEASYNRQYGKNEEPVIRQFVADGRASVAYIDPAGRFTVYDLTPLQAGASHPTISECGL